MRSPQFSSEFEDADTNINSAMNKALRDTQGLTSEMVEEVKQLLDIFHLPWVTAPFEAEAQCAYLEQQGLVQGKCCFLFDKCH
jgi:DNA excision repair protein ERCC-5